MTDNRYNPLPQYGSQPPVQYSCPPQGTRNTVPSGSRRGYVPPVRTAPPRPQVPPYAAFPEQGNIYRSVPANPRGFAPSGSVRRKSAVSRRNLWILLAACAAVLVLVLVLALAGSRPAHDRAPKDEVKSAVELHYGIFCPGVYVDGLSLGGLTAEEGLAAVQNMAQQQLNSWQVDLTYNGVTQSISADTLGIRTDITAALDAAWEVGHNTTGRKSDAELYDEIVRAAQEPRYFYTRQTEGDLSRISSIVNTIKQSLDRPPQNAEMTGFYPDRDDPFEFSDEVYGLDLNAQALAERITEMAVRRESGTVEIVPDPVRPEQTKNDLKLLYTKRGEAYTQISSSSDANRNDNIRLAFSRISGYRLDPGATFSFNKIVGERTAANNFKEAEEYEYGEHVMGIGGGVCQASTTVFQAAVRAGLEITKRSNHSDKVSYTDYGLDATVSWSGKRQVDLQFVNNTDSPVYFVAEVVPSRTRKNYLETHVVIYGKDMGGTTYDIRSERTGVLVASGGPKIIKDTSGKYATYTDERVSVSDPKEGYQYKTYRVEYTNGKQTNIVQIGDTCTYEPQQEKIYVGVKKR